MKAKFSAVLALVAFLSPLHSLADCPRTIGTSALGPPDPTSEVWYGSEAFAVLLPKDGVWPTTAAGHLIAVKLLWRSAGLEPFKESDLIVAVKSLAGSSPLPRISRASNALTGDWYMMTGVDIPAAGCWEFTGEYLGQKLNFVVETIERSR